MLKKKKYDFKVYGTGYIRLVMLFFAFFVCSLVGFINLYVIFFYILFGQEKYIYLKMK